MMPQEHEITEQADLDQKPVEAIEAVEPEPVVNELPDDTTTTPPTGEESVRSDAAGETPEVVAGAEPIGVEAAAVETTEADEADSSVIPEPEAAAEPVELTAEVPVAEADEAAVPEEADPVSETARAAEEPAALSEPEAATEVVESEVVESDAVESDAVESEETSPEVREEATFTSEVVPTDSPSSNEQAAFDQQMQETADLALAEEARTTDYSRFSKAELVGVVENLLVPLRSKQPSAADFKAIDAKLREIKPVFDQIKVEDRQRALDQYEAEVVAEGEQAGEFSYKADALTLKFDSLYGQLRGERNRFFQGLDKQKEDNFKVKTELLARLRALVESDEQNTASEKTWAAFKQIQDEWKAAGNVHSAHNNTLWDTYHALVDRYFNNRNIYFELKELDRKRNMQQKIELCEKVEKLAQQATDGTVTGAMLNEATALFEEYKHVGPAPRDANEVLWQRFKASMDTLYGKKREQLGASKEQAEEVYKLKADIAALAETFTTFQSSSINEWNDKTKALLAVQDQWNAVKGSMPREKGREISQKFWADVKTFFRHKGDFFRQLEAKRDENLKAKTALTEQVEALLENGDTSAEATNQVIEAQKRWKGIGHVPEKQRDKVFNRFKAACDAFFNKKRGKTAETDKQYDENLRLKNDLIAGIEAEAKADSPSLGRLNEFKAQWGEIGYVPRKDMQATQQRYIKAINQYVSAIGKLSGKEREQLVLESEAALVRDEGGGRDLYRRENDIRRKIQALENDISLTRNNLEFFARSKNSEKLRADFEKKIAASERELEGLKHQLKVIRQAEG